MKHLLTYMTIKIQTCYLECFAVEIDSLLCESLLTLDVGKVIQRVGMRRTKPQSCIVAFFRVLHVTLLLQGVRQVAVGIREVWLQLNGTSVCVNCQVNKPVTPKTSHIIV